MATLQLEPMSLGRIIDQAFRLYRSNFTRFIAIVAIVYVPLGLVMALGVSLLGTAVPGNPYTTSFTDLPATEYSDAEGIKVEFQYSESSVNPAIAGVLVMLIGVVGSVLGYNLCNAALLKSISETYLGREVLVSEAYRFVWPRVGTVIWAGILVALLIGLGFLLCFVPGIIIAMWLALTTPSIVVEKLSAREAMRRSKALTSGNLSKVFGLLFVVGIISIIVNMFISWAGVFVAGQLAGESAAANVWIRQFFEIIGQILVMPIGTAAIILLYYDLRIRKEGFDLEMLLESVGGGTNIVQETA